MTEGRRRRRSDDPVPVDAGADAPDESADSVPSPRTSQPGEPGSEITFLRLTPVNAPAGPSFALDHPYIELVYAPLIGASAVLFLRRAALLLRDGAEDIDIDPVVLAREIGLRSNSERPLGGRSPLMGVFRRLQHSRLIKWTEPNRIDIYREVPPVSARDLVKLPESARRLHERYVRT